MLLTHAPPAVYAEGEEAECCAAGGSFCAVATSRRQLRLLSQAGTQVRALPAAPGQWRGGLPIQDFGLPNPSACAESSDFFGQTFCRVICLVLDVPAPLPLAPHPTHIHTHPWCRPIC